MQITSLTSIKQGRRASGREGELRVTARPPQQGTRSPLPRGAEQSRSGDDGRGRTGPRTSQGASWGRMGPARAMKGTGTAVTELRQGPRV